MMARKGLHTPPAPRGDQKAGLNLDDRPIMTDAEVAGFFGISVRTLVRRVKKHKEGELRLTDAVHAVVGGRRFWVRDSVMRLAGVSAKWGQTCH